MFYFQPIGRGRALFHLIIHIAKESQAAHGELFIIYANEMAGRYFMRKSIRLLILAGLCLFAACASLHASTASGNSAGDEIGRVLLALIVALVAAKLGGEIATRLGQPAVLGELIFGVLVGNLTLVGWHGLAYIKDDRPVEVLSEIGIVLLLFQVGLESDLDKMKSLGASAVACASLGIVTSFALALVVVEFFMPDANIYARVFVAGLICSSSVGIGARVLMDLGRIRSLEAQTILGAAVVDDVMGLVLVAVLAALISSNGNGAASVSAATIVWMVVKAAVFLAGSVVLGRAAAPVIFKWAGRFRTSDMLLTTALGFCFGFWSLCHAGGSCPDHRCFHSGARA